MENKIMDLKDKMVSSFLAFENNVDVDHPIHDIRTEAIKNFELNQEQKWSIIISLGIKGHKRFDELLKKIGFEDDW